MKYQTFKIMYILYTKYTYDMRLEKKVLAHRVYVLIENILLIFLILQT